MLFPGRDFRRMAWQLRLNDVGAYRLELVAETSTKDLFVEHYGVMIERDVGQGMYEEYYGFHLDSEEWLEGEEVTEHYWASLGASPEWLLTLPLLMPNSRAARKSETQTAPLPEDYAAYVYRDEDGRLRLTPEFFTRYLIRHYETLTYESVWWYYGPADDAIKTMVEETLGETAGTARMLSPELFRVEGKAGQATPITVESERAYLLDAIQASIGPRGERGGCDFRVTHEDGFVFRTFTPYFGRDRRLGYSSQPLILGLAYGNIQAPRLKVMRREAVSTVYGAWQGGGAEQELYSLTDMEGMSRTPFSRRDLY